jgi:hypothetical protein
MRKWISISAVMVLSAGIAAAEIVTSSEFSKGNNRVPCSVDLNTDAGKKIDVLLSHNNDIWSLDLFVSDRASVYRRFFDNRGLRDEDAFSAAFSELRIGDRTFDFDEVTLFEVLQRDLDEETTGGFEIEEKHNVVPVLEAMANDGIEIQGLIALDGTADALREFRSCSYTSIGLQEGEKVRTDYRAEYRMIFEPAFETWISHMSRADSCFASQFDDDAVSEVVDAAANAFYPGVLNIGKRKEYKESFGLAVPLAKLSGINDARSKGCFMAGRLAEISRIPVDRIIEETSRLD